MIAVLSWYLLVTLVGLAALPTAFRILRFLPDRGYTLVKPLGLLLWGYLFWLLTSFGILQNNAGGVLFALLLLAGIGLWLNRHNWEETGAWLRAHRRLVFTTEILFIAAIALWALVRAANPNIIYTEKPMELAFINAILRSPQFPPNDPWLSGYAISYYYFGYVIVSMLIHLSGLAAQVAFNVAVALWFALTAVAGFGILYNLLYLFFHKHAARHATLAEQASAVQITHDPEDDQAATNNPVEFQPTNISRIQRRAVGWALLAPLFILLIGNLAGFLDILHARGVFWTRDDSGQLQSGFWTWLGIKEFNEPPPEPLDGVPKRSYWLWWRASRVVQDLTLQKEPVEVIDEFPFFSYLLADLHPHVLAMPFVLSAVGLSLNLFVSGRKRKFQTVSVKRYLGSHEFWLSAVLLGSLAFLNTWDFPIYVALYSAAFTLVRYQQNGWNRSRVADFITMGLMMGVSGVLLYLPFYIGFASQAGGLLPSLIFYTRGVQFWVMFAPLLVPILAWLFWQKKDQRTEIRQGMKYAALVVAGLWALMILAVLLVLIGEAAAQSLVSSASGRLAELGTSLLSLAGMFFGRQGGGGVELLLNSFVLRLINPGTWVTLLLMLGLALALMAEKNRLYTNRSGASAEEEPDTPGSTSDANRFVLLLVLTGSALTLVPEFFYLRDGFGVRMNTIFKFYFQAWIVWGLAAAYASAVLWNQLKARSALIFRISWSLVLAAALVYPALMLPLKIQRDSLTPFRLTLDGKAYLQQYSPDEWQAFMFLRDAPLGVVVEAVGPQYNPDYARVATHTGQPTVLGWEGHQVQWRGGSAEMGSRRADIELLYRGNDWNQTQMILSRYNIRYVYIGPVERSTYRVNENKFVQNLTPIFSNASVIIYEVPQSLTTLN